MKIANASDLFLTFDCIVSFRNGVFNFIGIALPKRTDAEQVLANKLRVCVGVHLARLQGVSLKVNRAVRIIFRRDAIAEQTVANLPQMAQLMRKSKERFGNGKVRSYKQSSVRKLQRCNLCAESLSV